MSQYYMLIKNGFIDFEKIFVEKYNLLDLNETEAIIILKLHKLLGEGAKKLDANLLAPHMSIDSLKISRFMVDLVKKGFLTLNIDNDGNESYNLDETYKRLGNIIDNSEEKEKNQKEINITKSVVKLVEEEFKHPVSPLELEIINHWLTIDKYDYETISEAVLKAVKAKKLAVKYVDVMLNLKKENKPNESLDDLQDLFNNVYGKIK